MPEPDEVTGLIRAETVSCLSNAAAITDNVPERSTRQAFAGACHGDASASGRLRTRSLAFVGAVVLSLSPGAWGDNVFLYSAEDEIRGINLDLGTENVLTTSPFTNTTNALATNSDDGVVYYGSGTEVFIWDIALGDGVAAHSRLNNFATGAVQAPITNLDSGSGSYLNGVYYVGSEAGGTGDAEDLYALNMSADGRTVLSATALGLLTACNCTGDEIGGFGDIAAVQEGVSTILYGVSAGGSDNTKTGRWRFDLGTSTWTHLAVGANGQLSNSVSGQLYTNVGNSIRTLNKTTGAVGTTNLFTLAAQIFDFTGGFSLDFGDAPASYGSAIHRVPAQTPATTFLGVLPPDNEAGTLDTAAGGFNGLGDDQAGVDDEDAVVQLNSLDTTDTAYAFPVSCTVGAFVSAWIDFNRNGSFDSNERSNNAAQICTSSSTTLAWTGLASNVAGVSYARIRVADAASDVSSPTGLSNSGEVEDYVMNIISPGGGACPVGQVSVVYPSADIPKTIPDSGAVSATSSTLTIGDSITILDVNVVDVIGTHSWLDDIRLSLIHSGTTVPLFGPACGNNDDFDFGFDDGSTNALVCPPVNGLNLVPSSSLSVFNNTSATGDWILDIEDVFPSEDGGALQSWALQICTLAGPAEAPDVRVGKVASVADSNVTLSFRALNSGNTSLSNISLTDNLDDAFGSGNYTIIQAPQIINAPSGFTINSAYAGNGLETDLLGNGGTLAPGEEVRVRITVRIDTFTAGVSQADYTNEAYASGISPSSGFAEDLSAPSMDLSIDIDQPTPISVRSELLVSGRVFLDASLNATTSHDGVIQLDEAGISGRLVSAFNAGTNQLIDSVVTDGNGDWVLQLDGDLAGTLLRIEIQASSALPFVSEASTYSVGSVTDGQVQVTPAAATALSGVNVGVVARPLLQLDQTQTAPPNSTVRHAHRYQASSPGQLSFDLSAEESPASAAWPARLLRDQNCNGVIEGTDLAIASAFAVLKDQVVCLIVDVFVSADQPLGANHTAALSATLSLDDAAGTGHSLQFEVLNTDRISVVSASDGRLLLAKTVRNVTSGGAAVESNVGLPGHVLEYTIRYLNQGIGVISELVINDSAPAYTQVQSGSVVCGATPAGITCTPGVASSDVRWDFIGSLNAGAEGTVVYQVVID